jgi:hypothetical protein
MAIDPRITNSFKANLNFYCNWQEETGKTWKESCEEWGKEPPSPSMCRLILYCGMKDEIGGLTLAECGKMTDVTNGSESWAYVFRVLTTGRGDDLKNQPPSPSGPSGGPSPGSPSE